MKNGFVKVLVLTLLAIRTAVSNNGKYYITTEPSPENPTGRWGRTAPQMRELAISAGVQSWQILARAAARGGCKLHLTMEFCEAGSASADDPNVVYSKDWWKLQAMNIELSPSAQSYVDSVTNVVDVQAEQAALADDSEKARKLRFALLTGATNVERDDDVDVDADADIDEPEEEEVLVDDKTSGKKKK